MDIKRTKKEKKGKLIIVREKEKKTIRDEQATVERNIYLGNKKYLYKPILKKNIFIDLI